MPARRLSIPLAILVVLTCASIAFFIFYGQDFPPTMAVRFSLDGQPVEWMDRVKFIVLASFVSFMLPTFAATLVGVLPRVLPVSVLNMPNKTYWLAAERKGAALDAWMWFGLWLGCLLQSLLIVTNVGIARANAAAPPTLSAAWLVLPVGLFLAGVLAWALSIRRAFSLPGSC